MNFLEDIPEIKSATQPTVEYRLGGDHVVAIVYCYNRQQTIILGKSLKAVEKNIILRDRDESIDLIRLFSCRIVKPESLIALHWQKNIDSALQSYRRQFVDLVKWSFLRQFLPLPKGIKECRDYSFSDPYCNDIVGSEEDDPEHYNCSNCLNGIKLNIPTDKIYSFLKGEGEVSIPQNYREFNWQAPAASLGPLEAVHLGSTVQISPVDEEFYWGADLGFFLQDRVELKDDFNRIDLKLRNAHKGEEYIRSLKAERENQRRINKQADKNERIRRFCEEHSV